MLRPAGGFGGFAVRDTAAAAAFYRDTLGLTVSEEMDGYVLDLSMPAHGGHVMVYSKPEHEPAAFTVLTLEVEDLEQAVDDLVAAGVQMERYEGMEQDERGIARGMGPDIAWIRDPSGNIFGVMGRVED